MRRSVIYPGLSILLASIILLLGHFPDTANAALEDPLISTWEQGQESETAGTVLYVVPDGEPTDCLSWNTACDLPTALDMAVSGDEIWVAEGTHYPSTTQSDSRLATFSLVSGVAVFGGFAGGETSLVQRNWTAYPTILSGDIDGNGERDDGNAYHVVTSYEVTSNATLDGFTITGGYANSSSFPHEHGGGLLSYDQSIITVKNVTFTGNAAYSRGGGFFHGLWSGHATLTNVTFTDNHAPTGGGVSIYYESATLTNVTFSENGAGYGGGMAIEDSAVKITNAIFYKNSGGTLGGGMFIDGCSPTLTNVTFYGNSTFDFGSGIGSYSSAPQLTNCILWGNTASQGHQIYGLATVMYSDIQNWSSGGAGNISTDPLFVDGDNGNLRLLSSSPVIDAGSNTAPMLVDTTDVDGDGNETEPLPYDLDGSPRFVDFTLSGLAVVDMGAYESQVQMIYLPLVLK